MTRRVVPTGPRPALLPLALVVAATLAIAACQDPGPSATSAPSVPPVTVPPVTPPPPTPTMPPVNPGGLVVTLAPFVEIDGSPLALAAPDDGTDRLFVAAQDGRIWAVENGAVLPAPMIDLSARITSGGERGLLGIAVHPRFPDDPRVFVDYTDTRGDLTVASLDVDPADPNRLRPGSHRVLLAVDHRAHGNHNGGAIAFGPDELLYVSTGDGGGGGDPFGAGQRTDILLGKILRLDVGDPGATAYAIPADNPFTGTAGMDEIWLYGLRNPWRMSFDRATGDLWIGDVGQGAYEEIDVARAGVGGLNFGWSVMEGSHCYGAATCDEGGLTLPVADYGRGEGSTIIGGYVYRGAASPALLGTYVFADYGSGNVFAIDPGLDELQEPVIVGRVGSGTAAFGEDSHGELYLLNLDGSISRVVASAT